MFQLYIFSYISLVFLEIKYLILFVLFCFYLIFYNNIGIYYFSD